MNNIFIVNVFREPRPCVLPSITVNNDTPTLDEEGVRNYHLRTKETEKSSSVSIRRAKRNEICNCRSRDEFNWGDGHEFSASANSERSLFIKRGLYSGRGARADGIVEV